MTKNKSIFLNIFIFFALFVLLLSLLFIFPFKSVSPKCKVFCADTSTVTYSFSSSDFTIPVTVYTDDVPTDVQQLRYYSEFFLRDVYISEDNGIKHLNGEVHVGDRYEYLFQLTNWGMSTQLYYDNNYNILWGYQCDENFNFDVKKVRIYTQETWGGNSNYRSVAIDYYDSENRVFGFGFRNSYVAFLNISFVQDRTYYFTNNFTDNEIYLLGLSDGENKGYEDGYDKGKSDGYNLGKDIGDTIGYQRGVREHNDYSFFTLFSAIFDAPVKVIYNLLDFEILGVNLFSFFSALVTVFIVIALIKFIRGR